MYLYVLSSVLLISLVFCVLSCYVSVYSEFRVAHFISFFVLSCYVSLCSEFRGVHFYIFVCCPVMYLYVLSSVLLISKCFLCYPVMYLYVLSSVLLLSLVFSCCPVMCLYVLSSMLLNSLVFFVLSSYVSVCSEFGVAHFFSFFRVVLLCVFMFGVPFSSFL